jgi:hypothetical protein
MNNTNYYDYNYIFTDYNSIFYFFAFDIALSRKPVEQKENILLGILESILEIGYVYKEPEKMTVHNRKVMRFFFKDKTNANEFFVDFIPMDNNCYKLRSLIPSEEIT